MPEIASQTVEFVGRELNVALAEARSALEAYVEQPQNLSLLERCTRELHQVLGVLRVLEIYGGALLAEEMEQVARYLVATADERKSQAEALDALMRAMAQLPSYLERVLAGDAIWRSYCFRCSTICAPCAAARSCQRGRCCSSTSNPIARRSPPPRSPASRCSQSSS